MKITQEFIADLEIMSDDMLAPRFKTIISKLYDFDKNVGKIIADRAKQISEDILDQERKRLLGAVTEINPLLAARFDHTPPSLAHRSTELGVLFQILSSQQNVGLSEIQKQAITFSNLSTAQRDRYAKAVLGDNIRQAIKEYMDEREIDPVQLKFTKAELASLSYIAPLGFSRHLAAKNPYDQPRSDPLPPRPA